MSLCRSRYPSVCNLYLYGDLLFQQPGSREPPLPFMGCRWALELAKLN